MAKFPIERSDNEGIIDALNYVLSGPGGLGQNFNGVSFSAPGYLTGNFSPAFTSPTPIAINVPPIAVSLAEKLSPNTFKYTFSAAQPSAPFFVGSNIRTSGFTKNQYNRLFIMGVVECTTTYVIARVRRQLGDPGSDATGGTAELSVPVYPSFNATDCDIRDITVTSPTDRVFVSAQILNSIYTDATVTSQMFYTVAVNRYRATTTNDPNNLDFIYDPINAETIAYRTYNISTISAGTGVLSLQESDTLFTNIVDQPGPGLYRYILELQFETGLGGDAVVSQCEFGYRSLSCQVVKE